MSKPGLGGGGCLQLREGPRNPRIPGEGLGVLELGGGLLAMGGPRIRNNPFLVQRLCTAPQHVIRKQELKAAQGSRGTCSCTGHHGPSFLREGGFEGRNDRGPLDDQSPPPSPTRPQATPGPCLTGAIVCLVLHQGANLRWASVPSVPPGNKDDLTES